MRIFYFVELTKALFVQDFEANEPQIWLPKAIFRVQQVAKEIIEYKEVLNSKKEYPPKRNFLNL